MYERIDQPAPDHLVTEESRDEAIEVLCQGEMVRKAAAVLASQGYGPGVVKRLQPEVVRDLAQLHISDHDGGGFRQRFDKIMED